MKVRELVVIVLFLVGLLSVSLLGIYVFALFVFVFGESDYPGVIAFVPKWIFLFSPLIFLGGRKEVQRFLGRRRIFF